MSLLRLPLKILYISQYFPPEMGAPSARVSELSRYWAMAGHDVTVLTGFPNHPDGVVRPEYRKRFWRGVCGETVDGIKVVRTFLLPFPNRKPYERILNYSSFCLSAGLAGSFLQHPDIVIATSPQLLVGLAGWWISRLKKVPFVLEVRDLWPESLAGAGVGGESSLLYKGIGRIAGFLYRRADKIAVVTPAFRDHLIQKCGVRDDKIAVIQNGVETKLFSPRQDAREIRSQIGAESKFIVSYIGTLGLAHGLDALIGAAEQLQTTDPDVLFLLVGEGADRERILARARAKGLANLHFVPQQPREMIPGYISASDACIVMLRGSQIFETVIPTKMLEFMSCARPVILAVRGQSQRVLESAGAGICIEPDNPGAICTAIRTLRQHPALRDEMGRNGRNYIIRELSREKTAIEYLSVLREIVGETPPQAAAAA